MSLECRLIGTKTIVSGTIDDMDLLVSFYENAHSRVKMFQNKFSSNISTKIDRNTIIRNIEIIESTDKDFGYFFPSSKNLVEEPAEGIISLFN